MSSYQHERPRVVSVAGARSQYLDALLRLRAEGGSGWPEDKAPRPRRGGWDPVFSALCWIGFGLLTGLALSELWP